MNSQTKAILIAFAIASVLGIVLLGVLILHGMSTAFGPNPQCKYAYGVNVYSPDRSYVVEVEDYVCRAWRLKTLSKRVVIVALPVTDLHKPPPGEIFEIKGDYPVKAVWLNKSHLLIECPNCDIQSIETRQEKWQDITISFSF